MSFGPFPRLQALGGRLPAGDGIERGNLLLKLLAEIAGQLLTARDGDALVRGVFEKIAPPLELDAYFNFMVNDAGDALHMASCAGIPEEAASRIQRLEFGQAVCGTVAMLRRPLVATGIQSSEDPKVQLVRGYGIRAYACNPLMSGNRLLGTLSFATRSRDRFAEDELEFFRTVSHYVATTEERRRMTAALQQQAALLDLAQDAIIATGLDGSIQFWNTGAEKLYGWNAVDARGRNYTDLLATQLPRSLDGIRRALENRPSWEAELQQKRRGGQSIRVWSRWAARRGADGRQTGFLILEHDLGERRKVEDRLRQAQKLEGMAVLAGGVAHDFNNLLTGILGNASLLEYHVTPAGEPFLKQVIYGAEQAGNLTRQLMAYAGKGESAAAEIDLSALATNTAGLLRVSVPKGIEIRLDLAPETPPIWADATQIQQVLMNLVINARDAIGPNTPGTIAVRTRMETVPDDDDSLPPGRYVALTVSDTGCGMDPKTAARIFDPFFTTKNTGHGLGLSSVLGIMRACGGRITVESQPGQGAEFRLLFPTCRAAIDRSLTVAGHCETRP